MKNLKALTIDEQQAVNGGRKSIPNPICWPWPPCPPKKDPMDPMLNAAAVS